ncbi:AmmeMemoRadiSam system protein B [bacterium]|nr:AmmeMemoRadiSam system protein B [candidate division CSSED10-310 bacterium]
MTGYHLKWQHIRKWGFIMTAAAFFYGNDALHAFSGTRDAMYAGSWYPGTRHELISAVDQYLAGADIPKLKGRVIGIVAPHAGYLYSAPVAAHAYKTVQGMEVDVVVLLGNAHREAFHGAAIDEVAEYRNPLGTVPVDVDLARQLSRNAAAVHINAKPHQKEHSLEIQLPFLQRTLKPGFKILPILFGYEPDGAEEQLVENLGKAYGEKKILFVASTDLTHYPTYSDAKTIDTRTVEIISSMNADLLRQFEVSQIAKGTTNLACILCAGTATRCVMTLCRQLGADQGHVLKYANSGDVAAGDRSQVVGYGAVAFTDDTRDQPETSPDSPELTPEEARRLLAFSRNVLTQYVSSGTTPDLPDAGRLNRIKRGVFVTLNIGDTLRGCIGYIEPVATCVEAVRDNTISACARDPRFPPVTLGELDRISIEISVLTPPRSIASPEEIVIGTHGIVLEKGPYRSVFLPQVASDQGWDRETTLMYLAMKAGLPTDGWKDAQFDVFEAQVLHEPDASGYDPAR